MSFLDDLISSLSSGDSDIMESFPLLGLASNDFAPTLEPLGQLGFGQGSAESAANFFEPALAATQSLDSYDMLGFPITASVQPSGPSFFDTISDYAGKADKFLGSSLGKNLIGGGGALLAYMDAKKRNALMQQMMEQAAARQSRLDAQREQFSAPARFTNQRAAQAWSAGSPRAFAKNSLSAMTPRSTNTMYAAQGGLASYVRGGTAGQDDKIPAMLSDGEYVFDADTVAALGDGNNEAGAARLDKMRQEIRKHKRSAPASKIPPKAKSPLQYMKKGAK